MRSSLALPVPLTLALAALCLPSNRSSAAGYAVAEQSISGLGYGYAGVAALAEDSSTAWFNPAGLTFLGGEPQVSGGVHFIVPRAEFRNTGTVSLNPAAGPTATVPTAGADATSDTAAAVPNLFYSQAVSEHLSLGVAINVPFGLTTEYPDDWVGRYIATETSLETVNLNTVFGYRLSEKVSIGGGVSVIHADAVLASAVDFGLIGLAQVGAAVLGPTLAGQIVGTRGETAFDGSLHLEGDDLGLGFNLGIILAPQPGTRVGLHYRSGIDLTLEGEADFTVPTALQPFLGAAFADQGGKVDLTLPASLSLSLYHELTTAVTLLADVTWTDWSQFDALVIEYENPSPPTSVVPEEWEDTLRYSVGVRILATERLALKGGIVLDEAAVPSPRYRSPRIPDAERFWFTLGLQFHVQEGFVIDLGYAHVFVDDAETRNDLHTAGQVLVGDNTASVDIFSLGAQYTF